MRKIASFVIAIVASLTLAPISTCAQQTLKDRIVGTWKIVSWETVRPDGQVINVWMGPHPTGLIIYQPNGYMAVQIMADPRPTFAQLPSTTPSSSDEFRNAFFGYYAYWGTYTVGAAGNSVIHNVQGSERPHEVGRTYERLVLMEGTSIVLTTPTYKAGAGLPHDLLERMKIPTDEALVNRLTFERVE
jgi:hypothetical protein